jgi:hypothetical protein
LRADKGFTAYFVSYSGKTHHRFEISGWKLHTARAILALAVLLLSAAVVITALGLLQSSELERLRTENARLEDSLSVRGFLEARLVAVEADLARIREDRLIIENMAGIITPVTDSTPAGND